MKSVTVLGAGGHAKVVISLLKSLGLTVKDVLDDDERKEGHELMGLFVQTPIELSDSQAICAHGIGSNHVRNIIANKLSKAHWPHFVHPTAFVDPSAKIGNGTVVMAGAIVQADAVIGNHVIVNTGATVDHDCVIGDYAHIAPGTHLAGENKIGEGVLMGVGCATIPQVSVGDWSVVGAGSVLGKSFTSKVLIAGNRAKVIKKL